MKKVNLIPPTINLICGSVANKTFIQQGSTEVDIRNQEVNVRPSAM